MANVLWTDIMDPVEATAVARDEQYVIEQANGGTLARYLPNVYVASDHVKFYPGTNGLVDAANYRAFGGKPEVGKGEGVTRKTIDLPSIARTEPIDELTQKELARLSDDRVKKSIESAIKRNVQAISMRQELTRGIAIDQGKVVISQGNYAINDDFGRDAALGIVAPNLWSSTSVDRLAALKAWKEVYVAKNDGLEPGRMLFSDTSWAALMAGLQFATLLGNGATRPALDSEVKAFLLSASLPPVEIYNRQYKVGGTLTKVLDPKKVYFLPEPVAPDAEEGSLLGATYWGQTVTATYDSWGIEPDEQPGIVCGIFRDDQVGGSIEAQGDSIGEPVLASPNAAMAIQVLA